MLLATSGECTIDIPQFIIGDSMNPELKTFLVSMIPAVVIPPVLCSFVYPREAKELLLDFLDTLSVIPEILYRFLVFLKKLFFEAVNYIGIAFFPEKQVDRINVWFKRFPENADVILVYAVTDLYFFLNIDEKRPEPYEFRRNIPAAEKDAFLNKMRNLLAKLVEFSITRDETIRLITNIVYIFYGKSSHYAVVKLLPFGKELIENALTCSTFFTPLVKNPCNNQSKKSA